MKLLAIETTTDACSVALHVDGNVRESHRHAPREHAALLMPTVDELLGAAGIAVRDLDAVAFGRGPGSFTGVRIGVSVAQGLGFGADVPLVPVSSLAALAQGASRTHGWRRIIAGQDARMDECYLGAYVVGIDDLVGPWMDEQVAAASVAQLPDGEGWGGAGSAFAVAGPTLADRLGDALVSVDADLAEPRAVHVAELAVAAFARGETVGAEDAAPVYLRDRVTRPRAAT